MIYAIIYFIIGIIIAFADFDILYKKEYEELKKKKEAQDSMVVLLLAFMVFLWPALIAWRYVRFLERVKKGIYKF